MQRKRLYGSKTAEEWCELYGNVISVKTFCRRIATGDFTPERAASAAAYCSKEKMRLIDGIPASKWLKKNNPEVSYAAFVSRLHNGYSVDKAARTPLLVKQAKNQKLPISDKYAETLYRIKSLEKGERIVWHHKQAHEKMRNPLAPYIADMAEEGKIHCFQRVISTNAAGEQEIEYIAEGR